MSYFTAAYLARMATWGLLIALLQGPLVLLSWLAWEQVLTNAKGAQRHRLLCVHFAALVTLPALTLAVLHSTIAKMGASGVHGLSIPGFASLIADENGSLGLAAFATVVWFAGTMTMALRLILELQGLRKLCRQPAAATLVGTIRSLARDWKDVPIPLVESADVFAPQIIGLCRPLLLLPNDFAHRLNAAERDTVLLHELAHVCRGDFGWNLVQRCALALLWFQPAAWLLYRRLASERERCCDDLAVRHGARATDLARALVRLAEKRVARGLAMAAYHHTDLTPRVHHLLGLRGAGPISNHHRAGAFAVSALCLLTLAAERLTHFDSSLASLCNASAFGWTVSINAQDPAGVFALRIRRGRVVEASVAERLLSEKDIHQDGNQVTLMGPQLQPAVLLTVTPQGAIQWDARVPHG